MKESKDNPDTRTMSCIAQFVSLLLVVLIASASSCKKPDKGYMEDTDPEMAAAIAEAQATLPQFWQAYEQRAQGESNFTLVFRITDQGRMEHFFTTDFERRDGKAMVTVTNSPKIVTSVNPGDQIEIPETDITDWFYQRDGKYVGLRTMKPRFKYMPPDMVESFKGAMANP